MDSTLIPPAMDDRIAQRAAGLREARRINMARAALLHRMHEKERPESCAMAADMIADPPDVLRSLSVLKFLERVRKIGSSTAPKLLGACQIPELTPLGALMPRQRSVLESVLRVRAAA